MSSATDYISFFVVIIYYNFIISVVFFYVNSIY